MKKKVLQFLGLVTIRCLQFLDRYTTGSHAGIPFEEDMRDPYRAFNIMRQRGHILRSLTYRGWMVLGFEEVQALFRDPRFGSDIRKNAFLTNMLRLSAEGREVSFLDSPTMLNLDPPDHTRLRRLVNHGFGHKFIMSLEPRIDQIVDQCLGDYDPATGQYDIMEQLARPLPVIVIAELLGLPEKDIPFFHELSGDLLGLTALGNSELMDKGAAANEALVRYFEGVIEDKRKNPDQAMISLLIAAEEEGDRLTPEELYSTCVLLLIAGHETTARLIGNGMYLLMNHPEQMEKLKANPELAENAIEEILRYEPPVQIIPRFALDDVEFYGRKIKKHQLIVPVMASANRDPAANPNPEVFDIEREDIKHVSFGHGIHLCLGLNLARLEGKIAINRLLARFPEMTLAEQELEWTAIPLVRGMENLVIDTNERVQSIETAA